MPKSRRVVETLAKQMARLSTNKVIGKRADTESYIQEGAR